MSKIFHTLVIGGSYGSAILIVVVTVLMIYEVFSRYILHSPSIWSLDIVRYSILYLAFLGAAFVLREEAHVKIEIITSRFSPKSQALIHGVTSVIALAACGIFCWQGAKSTWEAYQTAEFVERSIIVSRSLLLWVMPFGTFLLCIQFARRALKFFRIFNTPGRIGELTERADLREISSM